MTTDPLRRHGGARPGAGAPKTDAPKRVSRSISLLPTQWARIDEHAKERGLTRSGAVGDLVRHCWDCGESGGCDC